MKRIVLILGFLLIFTGVVFAEAPEFAPLNPEYVKYLEQAEQKNNSSTKAIDKALGYAPPPNKFHTEISGNMKSKGPLPSCFDLRTYNHVSPVKDQGSSNTCWAFTAIASLESCWIKIGLGEFDLSENSMKECHGFLWGANGGGNSVMSTAYLSRMNGPKLETANPYSLRDGSCSSAGDPVMYVSDYRILPADSDIIKEVVYTNGAIYSNMRWEDSAYRESDNTYYYYSVIADDNIPDHAVTIVGWDDNKETAGGIGAWIIKNSWGAEWGESGYFYISYNDTAVLTENSFWPNTIPYNTEVTLYMYDNLGAVMHFGNERNNIDYGLIKFTASSDLQLKKIGLWINYGGTEVDIEIFDDFIDESLTNPRGALTSKICTYAGYYTFDLDSSINISMSNDFYIKVKYIAPPGSEFVIPVESSVDGYANPIIESGRCWVSNTGSDNSWLSVGNNVPEFKLDLCIRAYTTPPPNARSEVITNATIAVTENTAECSGDITFLGTAGITQHGVCWGRSMRPKITDNKTSEGPADSTGPFSVMISGLSAGTTYYYRAYATGNAGTSYGADMTFKTSDYTPINLGDIDDDNSSGCFIGSQMSK